MHIPHRCLLCCLFCLVVTVLLFFFFFFFNDTATTEIYTLSLHDALPISLLSQCSSSTYFAGCSALRNTSNCRQPGSCRSEEHTSELQSRLHLVCRLLLEKKKTKRNHHPC